MKLSKLILPVMALSLGVVGCEKDANQIKFG